MFLTETGHRLADRKGISGRSAADAFRGQL